MCLISDSSLIVQADYFNFICFSCIVLSAAHYILISTATASLNDMAQSRTAVKYIAQKISVIANAHPKRNAKQIEKHFIIIHLYKIHNR